MGTAKENSRLMSDVTSPEDLDQVKELAAHMAYNLCHLGIPHEELVGFLIDHIKLGIKEYLSKHANKS